MCYDEGEGVEYDIVGCAISNNMEKLDEKLQNQVKDGMYTLAYNPDTKIDEAIKNLLKVHLRVLPTMLIQIAVIRRHLRKSQRIRTPLQLLPWRGGSI